jgi:hypothetical protein
MHVPGPIDSLGVRAISHVIANEMTCPSLAKISTGEKTVGLSPDASLCKLSAILFGHNKVSAPVVIEVLILPFVAIIAHVAACSVHHVPLHRMQARENFGSVIITAAI